MSGEELQHPTHGSERSGSASIDAQIRTQQSASESEHRLETDGDTIEWRTASEAAALMIRHLSAHAEIHLDAKVRDDDEDVYWH